MTTVLTVFKCFILVVIKLTLISSQILRLLLRKQEATITV